MEFRDFSKKDIKEASVILACRHKNERKVFKNLKKEFESNLYTEKALKKLLKNDYVMGICAFKDNVLVGFLISYIMIDNVLGRSAHIDYEGLGILDTESGELYRNLYCEISKKWLANGVFSHYVEVPAGNKETIEAWLKLSFSFQQVYGINTLSKKEIENPNNISIKVGCKDDAQRLSKLSNLIYLHQAESPVYAAALPERICELKQGYKELLSDEGSMTLLAYDGDNLVGFQTASYEQNEFSMKDPEKSFELLISGVVEKYRHNRIGHLLTSSMFNQTLELGYKNVIVDWRITNLASSNFWPKYGFVPIAYRMFREVDSRVLWSNGKQSLEQ